MNTLNLCRLLVVSGFALGLVSFAVTASHIGDPLYTLIPEFAAGATHAWYHALREVSGDLVAMLVILAVIFATVQNRTPFTWYLALVLMLGYYAPFWIGIPFFGQLSAPNLAAEIIHIVMAALPVAGLLIARKEFQWAELSIKDMATAKPKSL